jgi:hypothetical protein
MVSLSFSFSFSFSISRALPCSLSSIFPHHAAFFPALCFQMLARPVSQNGFSMVFPMIDFGLLLHLGGAPIAWSSFVRICFLASSLLLRWYAKLKRRSCGGRLKLWSFTNL